MVVLSRANRLQTIAILRFAQDDKGRDVARKIPTLASPIDLAQGRLTVGHPRRHRWCPGAKHVQSVQGYRILRFAQDDKQTPRSG